MPKTRIGSRTVKAREGKVRGSTQRDVQSVIFPLSLWPDEQERIDWLERHDFAGDLPEENEGEIRYEQVEEEHFELQSMTTVFLQGDPSKSLTAAEADAAETEENKRRVIFRMSPALHDRLKQFADHEDLSTNQAACRALEKFLSGQSSSGATNNPNSREGRMAELRGLRELRSILDPKKDKDAITKVDGMIRDLARKLAGIEDATPPEPSKRKNYMELYGLYGND